MSRNRTAPVVFGGKFNVECPVIAVLGGCFIHTIIPISQNPDQVILITLFWIKYELPSFLLDPGGLLEPHW